MWIRDLAGQLDKLGDSVAVTYSPASLVPDLADRPAAAMVRPADAGESWRPPFWAYLEPVGATTGWSLELLDAAFEAAYREYYGDYAFYPGDLPGSLAYQA